MLAMKLWLRWMLVAFIVVAFFYVWILPLIRPHGLYLWGHYRLRDLFLALPTGLALLSLITILLARAEERRRLALKLTFSCLMVLLTFFSLDIWYSLIYLGAWQGNIYFDRAPQPRTRVYVHNDELGIRRRSLLVWRGNFGPNSQVTEIRTDENGFRNPPGIQQADVVFIGDSYTFAGEAAEENTFVQIVGKESGLRVVNLGESGYGPPQELLVLQKFGLKYNPRYVVWQIFEGNDLRDAEIFKLFKKDPSFLSISLPARYLKNSIITTLAAATLPGTPLPYVDAVPGAFKLSSGETKRGYIHLAYLKDRLKERAEGLEETKRAIAEGHRICQERGARLLVIFVPNFIRVMEPYVVFDRVSDRQRFLPDNAVTDENDFTQHLERHSKEVGYSFIDLYPALKERAQPDNWPQVMMPDNEHFDVEGHRITAREVLAWLRSQPRAHPTE